MPGNLLPNQLAVLLWRAARVAQIAANGGDEEGYGRDRYEDDWLEISADLLRTARAIDRTTTDNLGAPFGAGDTSKPLVTDDVDEDDWDDE